MTIACRICGNSLDNKVHRAREMMFGTREEFDYLECAACGTVQIVEVPDLATHYPQDYYALNESFESWSPKKLRSRIAARAVARHFLHGGNPVGRLLAARGHWLVKQFPVWLREPALGIGFDSRILDFGSGRGKLLNTLSFFGFRHLTGADAFIDRDIEYPNGVRILKRQLSELPPGFDLVMLHHSFEHLPDPAESLAQIRRILMPGGAALIRIPLAHHAWRTYGIDWFQLDAPRHLFLYTESSFRRLAKEAGLEVEKVVYDSEAAQFQVSEQYARDISMFDERAFRGDFSKAVFTEEQFREWEKKAEQLNAEAQGDQACFYLRKRGGRVTGDR